MTYQEATKRLHELAGELYATNEYRTVSHGGRVTNYCRLYIEDAPHTIEAETWEMAFEKLAIARGEISIPAEQAPA